MENSGKETPVRNQSYHQWDVMTVSPIPGALLLFKTVIVDGRLSTEVKISRERFVIIDTHFAK